MARPCLCDRAIEGNYTQDQCKECWKWKNSDYWRSRWSDVPLKTFGRFSLDCSYRGAPTGETVPCKVCGGREVDVPVYACLVHGRCTLKHVGTHGAPKWCRTCKEKSTVKWSYGVTTVRKRRDDLLPRTLASLRAAGFDRPHLFVDGCNDSRSWHDEFGLDVTARGGPNVRTAGNWVLSMYELWARDPNADYYAVFQDDFVTSLNLRRYIERNPCPKPGYMNLYTFPRNQRIAPKTAAGGTVDGWFKAVTAAKGKMEADEYGGAREVVFNTGWGAVALVFTREGVEDILGNRELVKRFRDPTRGHIAIDGGVVHVMNKMGYAEYVHSPSLVQHTGQVSSMGSKRHPQAESFRGEEFDLLTLLNQASTVGA